MATRDAQRLADQQGLDLVEISPNAEPPVCKIMDYGKFRYEESIRNKQARKNQKTTQIKEIKFHVGVDVNDLQHKLKQIKDFLASGHKIKVTLQFRGRENAHKELGTEVVNNVIEACSEVSVVEQSPKLIGRTLGCLLAPKSATAAKPGSPAKAKPAADSKPQTGPHAPAADSKPPVVHQSGPNSRPPTFHPGGHR